MRLMVVSLTREQRDNYYYAIIMVVYYIIPIRHHISITIYLQRRSYAQYLSYFICSMLDNCK